MLCARGAACFPGTPELTDPQEDCYTSLLADKPQKRLQDSPSRDGKVQTCIGRTPHPCIMPDTGMAIPLKLMTAPETHNKQRNLTARAGWPPATLTRVCCNCF